jgi:acylglycerol lipase
VKEVSEAFRSDPNNYTGKMRIGTGLALQEGFLEIQNHLHEIDVPFLICFGDKDFVCDIEGAKSLMEKSPQKDKELKIYEDQYHDMLWEPKKDELFDDISKWIGERTK